MIIRSTLAWVLQNTGVRKTKHATGKERKLTQEYTTEAIWSLILWDHLSRSHIKTTSQGCVEEKRNMSLIYHLPVVKAYLHGTLFPLLFFLIMHWLQEVCLAQKGSSQVESQRYVEETLGKANWVAIMCNYFKSMQIWSLHCWFRSETKKKGPKPG